MKKINTLGMILLIVILANMGCIKVQAASKFVPVSEYYGNKTIKGVTYGVDVIGRGEYEIFMIKNGVKKTILSDTTQVFYTDGKTIFYEGLGDGGWDADKRILYKYSIETGKNEKLISGAGYSIKGCTDKYVYFCGKYNPKEETSKLYVLNVKTKKKKYITKHAQYVNFTKDRVITGDESGVAYNGPIYSFKYDGSGKKKIATGCAVKTKGNTVYYQKLDAKRWLFKVYSCTSKGKKRKALTRWLKYDKIPKKYR